MDSMIGYKNEKYMFLGRAAAKTDDLFNFIPARLSAFFMIISAFILKYDYKNAYKIFKRDRFNHKSPNSAQTESVCAGALNVMLAGDAWYFGKLVKKPTIGDNNRKIQHNDIIKANKMMILTSVLFLVIGILIRLAVSLILRHEHGGNIYAKKCDIDFSSNINPLGMSEDIKKDFINSFNMSVFYPDPECTELRKKLSLKEKVDFDNIICSNGAADVFLQYALL